MEKDFSGWHRNARYIPWNGREGKMRRAEKRFWDFVIRHRWKLLAAAAAIFSLYARYALRGIISADMRDCLLPWYEEIRSGGGLASLSGQVGNYNIPYQTLIAIMTYLPVRPEYAYKVLSVLFDYALAAAVALGAHEITGSREKAVTAWAVTLCLPVTVLNSAAWGQCDSIYTFFLVIAFVCLLRGKYTAAFLLYGCSLAFKLQAVFFLPFLLFHYVWSRKYSASRFLLMPLPVIALSAGGLLQGRSLADVFSVYAEQTNTFTRISLNYPSFWNLLVENNVKDGSDFYPELYRWCILTAVIVLAVWMVWTVRREKMGTGTLTLTALVMVYTCVMFLPAMHERYAYPVLMLAVLACFAETRAIPVALGLLFIDMQTYGNYLFLKEPLPWIVLVLINTACYAYLAWVTAKNIQTAKRAAESA